MSGIVAYEPADMTVTATGDCGMDVLSAALAEHRQWLPVDVAWPERTTAGDLVAQNLCGPLRASQGTVRDYLIGLRWRDRDGRLVSSGGRVVKNVAGYDLAKMHIGARGAFGEIVEATFKVRPKPAREVAVTFECASPSAAAEAALVVRDLVDPAWCVVRCGDGRSQVTAGVLGSDRVADVQSRVLVERWGARREEGGEARRLEVAREMAALRLLVAVVPDRVHACLALLAERGRKALSDTASGRVFYDPAEGPPPAVDLPRRNEVAERLRRDLAAAFSASAVAPDG